ncbi:MAG: hypothetical protein AUH11_18510 [Acidobacteria bacterium 13_2_20CM_57_17]|nr:MAG: hypothetical protein AUH11_18510 [Acidobacteria bacterium 13_2_20CM_57_17]OLB94260.1 MAG: hypothetical protein AUI02_05500 [Acidobacteria bacterium 13_2_20CM_2_57_12]OLE14997.1 MAG: hypothetical protein AUG83_08795 [Acidobacteria bacterium 13_1_20CM_4_57_11]
MRSARLILSFGLCVLLVIPSAAQQTASSSIQASQLLQQSLAALQGNTSLTDVTLSGTARRIAGSDDEFGTGIFKALAVGAARMDLTLSSGQRSEVENLSAASPTGSWSGPDRVAHPIAFHNLLTEPSWFFPAFAIARRLSNSGYVATYVGHETHEGHVVEHVAVFQPYSKPAKTAEILQHLSQIDLYLDSTSFLPLSIAFNIHPDDNELVDFPVEINFSDYRTVNGAQVPHHVQKFLNNSLILDFQADSVALNSGLTASTFGAL